MLRGAQQNSNNSSKTTPTATVYIEKYGFFFVVSVSQMNLPHIQWFIESTNLWIIFSLVGKKKKTSLAIHKCILQL